MKIYEIGTGYTPIPAKISAATEIVVEALANAMIRAGAEVTVVDVQASSRPETTLPILEVPVPKLFSGTDISLGLGHKIKRVTYSLALTRVLKTILRRADQPVVFHFHNQYNLFFFLKLTPAPLRRRCFIAYTNHSGIWRQPWKKIQKTVRSRYFQEAHCLRQADLVFVLNEETKQNMMVHLAVPEDRIRLIPHGVDTQVYRPLPDADKQAAKAALGLADAEILLQVGSVCQNKGQLRVVEALLPLLQRRRDLVYGYAGGIVEEDYQRKIREFSAKHGISEQVCYLGMVAPGEALNGVYNTARATVLASRYESFGLVAIESLAAGVPVLVEETSTLDFGPGCLRFRPETLEALLAQDLSPYASAARANALARYPWEAVAEAHLRGFSERMVNHG